MTIDITKTEKPTLLPGYYIQIYREKVPGRTKTERFKSLSKVLDLYKSLGVVGILWHGFSKEMTPEVFKPLAQLCIDRGMLALAAYGLDSTDPIGKAERMALVANLPECYALVLDAEGLFEDEASDKATTKKMGKRLRELCPNVLILDQPWFAPRVHWSMFPWEEFAEFIDMTMPQVYCNNFTSRYGKEAYEEVWKWYEKDWKALEERLAKNNLVRPRSATIQGYKWDLSDLINCLTKNSTLFVWAEPYVDNVFIRGLGVVKKLKELGFTGPEAVKNFQLSTNGQLEADNICGDKTIKQLGV